MSAHRVEPRLRWQGPTSAEHRDKNGLVERSQNAAADKLFQEHRGASGLVRSVGSPVPSSSWVCRRL